MFGLYHKQNSYTRKQRGGEFRKVRSFGLNTTKQIIKGQKKEYYSFWGKENYQFDGYYMCCNYSILFEHPHYRIRKVFTDLSMFQNILNRIHKE